jgi:hypothetical protein
MKDIYFYETIDDWNNERPTTSVKGRVVSKTESYIEIYDENGFTQLININKLFAVVY